MRKNGILSNCVGFIFNLYLIFLYFNQNIIPDELLKGKIEFIKGNATLLLPHQKVSTIAKLNDAIIEDTSILTQDKTYMRIAFEDGSKMSIGPSSKVVISKMKKNETKVWAFLKGNIRTHMQTKSTKSPSGDYKYMVKTKTAALGVRGTTFMSIYNPINEQSSIVTIEGEVDLGDPKSEKIVRVPQGSFAGINSSKKEPEQAQKINPKQFSMLAHKDPGGLTYDLGGITKEQPTSAVLETSGMVDFATGLLVKPEFGSVSEVDGSYIPPKGLRVDPLKGLSIDEQKFTKLSRTEQLALVGIVDDKKALNKVKIKKKKIKRKYEMRVQYGAFENIMSFTLLQPRRHKTLMHHLLKISILTKRANEKNAMQIDISRSNMNFSKESFSKVEQSSHDLYGLNISYIFNYNYGLRIAVGGGMDQKFRPYYDPMTYDATSNSLYMKRISRFGLQLMGQYTSTFDPIYGVVGRMKLQYRFSPSASSDFSNNVVKGIELGPWYKLDRFLYLHCLFNGLWDSSQYKGHDLTDTQYGIGLELLVEF